MNILKQAAFSLAAASMVAAPVAASAAPQTLRADTEVTADANTQAEGGFPFLIVFVVIAVGLGLYFVLDDGDDSPTSP